jgi:hypothetical protein
VARDPRTRAPALQAERAALQLRSIAREALPGVTVGGQAQYQSQVTRLPLQLPPALTGGAALPVPPNETYDAQLRAEAPLVDPTRRARMAARRASWPRSRRRWSRRCSACAGRWSTPTSPPRCSARARRRSPPA